MVREIVCSTNKVIYINLKKEVDLIRLKITFGSVSCLNIK